MKQTSESSSKRTILYVLLSALVVVIVIGATACYICSKAMTEDFVVRDLERGKAGTVDMTIEGVPSTVYYGPIEHVDWSVAVIVEK